MEEKNSWKNHWTPSWRNAKPFALKRIGSKAPKLETLRQWLIRIIKYDLALVDWEPEKR